MKSKKSRPTQRARWVSAAELAREYDVHESTVRRWPQQGCPSTRRGKRHSFDPSAVEEWLEQAARDDRELAAALTRKIDAQSRREARIIGELATSHIPRSEAELAFAQERARMASRLVRVPHELAPALVTAIGDGAGEAELAVLLRAHAKSVLEDLADDSDLGPPPSPREPIPVRASSSVRQARAQFADLQGLAIEIRERIAAGAQSTR